MKTKRVEAYMKAHRKNEFYAKRVRGGYYAVIELCGDRWVRYVDGVFGGFRGSRYRSYSQA